MKEGVRINGRETMQYNYFPGCTLSTKAKELDLYARRAAEVLGFPLAELPEWQCCGAVYPMARDAVGERLSAVRALIAAQERGGKLITLCSACHHVLKRVNDDMRTQEELCAKVNSYLETAVFYRGETEVVHYLEVLKKDIGFVKLREMVQKPLTGRRIGAYYGCMLLRPAQVMDFDDAENPTILEDFIAALGAEPVSFDMRNECCAGCLAVTQQEKSRSMANEILASAHREGVGELITACPLCAYNLQVNAADELRLPLHYFTELLAEALGLKEGDA